MTKAAFDKSAGGERKGASMCLSISLMFYHLEIFFFILCYTMLFLYHCGADLLFEHVL